MILMVCCFNYNFVPYLCMFINFTYRIRYTYFVFIDLLQWIFHNNVQTGQYFLYTEPKTKIFWIEVTIYMYT